MDPFALSITLTSDPFKEPSYANTLTSTLEDIAQELIDSTPEDSDEDGGSKGKTTHNRRTNNWKDREENQTLETTDYAELSGQSQRKYRKNKTNKKAISQLKAKNNNQKQHIRELKLKKNIWQKHQAKTKYKRAEETKRGCKSPTKLDTTSYQNSWNTSTGN